MREANKKQHSFICKGLDIMAGFASIVVSGLDRLEANLIREFDKFEAQAREAVREEAFELKEESQFEVPVMSGALQASAYVREAQSGNKMVAYIIGYGGADAKTGARGYSTSNYALAVHEKLFAQHVNGKAKYLEDPLNRRAARFEGSLARRLQGIW